MLVIGLFSSGAVLHETSDPKEIAAAVTTDDPARVAAKDVIVAGVERLHGRIWNGEAKNARIRIDRIRAVTHHLRGEPGERNSVASSRKLWMTLHSLDGYLIDQSARPANYGDRYRVRSRVGTATHEETANFLAIRRLNKTQQMRWSRRGADLLPQVRRAVDNGTLHSGFGQKFRPPNDPFPQARMAARVPILRQSCVPPGASFAIE